MQYLKGFESGNDYFLGFRVLVVPPSEISDTSEALSEISEFRSVSSVGVGVRRIERLGITGKSPPSIGSSTIE